MEDNYYVYIHINKINDKKYVGITKTSLEKRWGKNGSGYTRNHKSAFGRAIEKYGWNNFEHRIFTSNVNKECACRLETILIETLRTRDKRYGYNIQLGGQLGNAGVSFTEESKAKMREAKKGKKLTNEHKQRISISCKGHKPAVFTEVSKAKLRLANTGKTLSEETRMKISKALTGVAKSEDARQKMKDNHANKHGVFCPQLNEYFNTMKDVYEKYGIPHSNIEQCLSGKRKSAGKHPITGEKLTWVDAKE
jgi:group I intron endonuclease